ncbi:uncharacterized protein LOC132204555 [Neocloeon triangulifer]|uniref:uncharacterized protein LOC132204555 n=1 Tax=Neocloeon triangulifer TaxID=2078957 RepID=UPI00286F5053|nr:uncharacterized protein LOC132204555 [Neocloeon triangulifer]
MTSKLAKVVVSIFQVLAILTVVKGQLHIVKLIILAVFGLGGLVLYQAVASGSPLSHISTAVGKRSVSQWTRISRLGSAPSIASALELDEKECARLYLCEMASSRQLPDDKMLPTHLRAKSAQDEIALAEFRAAARFGEQNQSTEKCRQRYKKCPFKSMRQMERVISQYQNL